MGHFGSLSKVRSLAPFLRPLADLLAEQPAWREHFRLEVYGSEIDPDARSLIATLGLNEVVLPMGRLEYDKATGLSGRERVVQRMQQVDALLLLHGDTAECPQYIPSKLYDYFWTRRPVFALTHHNPQLDELVRAHGGQVSPTTDRQAVRQGGDRAAGKRGAVRAGHRDGGHRPSARGNWRASEGVNGSGVPEQRAGTCPIEAQSTAVARATASVCRD
jgi:hypothetical protein